MTGGRPWSITCRAASALNSSVYRLPLMCTSVIAVMYGLEVSREAGAIHHYEGGVSRIPVETLAQAAAALGVSVEEMIGTPTSRSAGKRGPAPKLQQQLERIQQLPKARQRMVSEVLDSLLAQAGR